VSDFTFAALTWVVPFLEGYADMAQAPAPAPVIVPFMCESVTRNPLPLYVLPKEQFKDEGVSLSVPL
jgi:hypothetical protein